MILPFSRPGALAFGLAVLIGLAGRRAGASPGFTTPSFAGQPNTTSQLWDGYTSPAGPNPPTAFSNSAGTANWLDTTSSTDGAFDIGSPPNAHVYSFSGVLNPRATFSTPNLGSNSLTTVVLQVETAGSSLSAGSFVVIPSQMAAVLPSSAIDNRGAPDGQGGFIEDWVVTWNNLPGHDFTVNYSASDTSSSQVGTRIDTQTSTPEPAFFGIFSIVGAGLALRRRRRTI